MRESDERLLVVLIAQDSLHQIIVVHTSSQYGSAYFVKPRFSGRIILSEVLHW